MEETGAWLGRRMVELEARMMVGRVSGTGAQVEQKRRVDGVSGVGYRVSGIGYGV
jgi:hypothetical protein